MPAAIPDPADSQEPRWRRLPEERPRQILEAAFAVFGEHGLDAARLDDIARRAGVSKGTIYLYFANKEALFREMIRQTIVARLEDAQRDLEGHPGSAAEQLRQYMRGWWAFLRSPEYQTVYRLVHAELPRFPDLARFYAQEVVKRYHALVGGMIQRGVEAGEFRPIDPIVAARMLSSILITQSVWCTNRPSFSPFAKMSSEQMIADIIDFYFRALERSPGTITSP